MNWSPGPNREISFGQAAACGRFAGQRLVAANAAGFVSSIIGRRTATSFVMLLIYGKNEQDDLTPDQLRLLKRLVEEEFK
jgi:hypothetical protein